MAAARIVNRVLAADMDGNRFVTMLPVYLEPLCGSLRLLVQSFRFLSSLLRGLLFLPLFLVLLALVAHDAPQCNRPSAESCGS